MGWDNAQRHRPWRNAGWLAAENRRLRRRLARLEARLSIADGDPATGDALTLQYEQLAATVRMAGLVAHELNTPLQAVENYLFLAVAPDDLAEVLPALRQEVRRIGAIVQRLREFEPLRDERPELLAVNSLVERTLLLVGGRLRRQGVVVVTELAPGLPALQGHSDALTLVLLNLILHAAEGMPEGGALHIATAHARGDGRHTGDALTIELTDTGAPGAAAASTHEPFYSTEAAGPEQRIEICRHLLASHGGTLMRWEELGGGNRMVVRLPLGSPRR